MFQDPSNLTAAAMSFNIENESIVCQLHHKSKPNNSVNVVCELSEKIGSPQFENGEWVVPSDVTGLNGKKPKVVKVRFHPTVSQMSSGDAALHQAACESALKYLDLLLEESVWTRKSDQDDQIFGSQLDKIIAYLSDMDKVVEIETNRVGLSFLHNESFDELIKLISCKSISSHLHTIISEDDDAHQMAQIVFKRGKFSRPLISLEVDADYLKAQQSGEECVFEASKSCFTWVLSRTENDLEHSPPNVSQKLDCFMWIDGKKQEMPVYSPCATVFHHLDKLSTLINTCGSSNGNGFLQKVPHTLAVDAIIGLDKSEAPHLHKFIQNITQAPLMIHTDFDNESLDTYQDSECKFKISPTDSVDSGVSLTSPTRQTSFEDDEDDDEFMSPPGIRSRSRSESCSSLKGILKWPRPPTNPMSRFASKPHLMRSYSECHHDDVQFPQMMMPLRFSEDDEDAFHEEDDDSSSDSLVLPAAPRKKSVSFSERLQQTRLFNSNTSINAQKLKNLKKNEKKKKRENSLASSIESIHEEIQTTGRISPATRHQTV
uniref:SH2 domain-containing protein n=1 Tax=Caenorhabditis tropicalis TaxID=1561998 RepID=A0A1I7U2U0_9PELO